jgi:hypothetical protein
VQSPEEGMGPHHVSVGPLARRPVAEGPAVTRAQIADQDTIAVLDRVPKGAGGASSPGAEWLLPAVPIGAQ